MKAKKRIIIPAVGVITLIALGVAYAYADSFGVIIKSGNGYGIVGGDTYKVTQGTSAWAGLNGDVLLAHDSVAGKSIIQGDKSGQVINNGYLADYPSNIQTWASKYGGNLQWVQQKVGGEVFKIQDNSTYNITNLVPLVDIINESGAVMGNPTYTLNGGTDGKGQPTYDCSYSPQPSAPPSVNNFTASVSGSAVTFNANVKVPLWKSLAIYHYDSIQVTDQKGNSTWVVGSSSTDDTQDGAMASQSGSQGSFPDSFSINTLQPGTYTASFWVGDGVDRVSSATTTTFTILPTTGPPVPSISLTANPTSLNTGDTSALTATASNAPTGSEIEFVDQSGKATLSGADYQIVNSSTTATNNAKDNNAEIVNYVAEIIDANANIIATSNIVSVTWNSTAPPPQPNTTSLTLDAQPTTLRVGSATTLTVTIPPAPNGGAAPQGEFVQIYDQTTHQNVGMGGYTGSPSFTYQFTDSGEEEIYTTTYSSDTVGPQTFIAQLWNSGVTPWNNPPVLTSNTATVTWVKPTVTLNANPASVFTGLPSQISYTAVGMETGDYVTVSGSGGQHMWSEASDPNANDSFNETENSVSGGTTTVSYTAKLCDSTGKVLSTSTISVSWIAPTITMNANPSSNLPKQTSTISYTVNEPLPSGFTVHVVPNGNGASMWSGSGYTAQTDNYKETENPTGGQTININYTATILDPSDNPIASGGTSVSWANPWTGTITLTANPKFLPTGASTTLTSTTTQPIPSGWNLVILDETTGQMVSESGTTPETSQYASFAAETDTFVAYLDDGFGQVGNLSNTVQVVWSQLALNANPTQLPAGDNSVLTVTGQNVPAGDYLVIFNETTGQEVGYSQSTPYSVNVKEMTPQTDKFVAFMSTNSSSSGQLIESNEVYVYWYGVTLTANPTRLPINNTSLLVATAQNLPTGYAIDIVDQTNGETISTGQPGETTLQVFQTKNQVETDKYVAQVVQPNNPSIPGLSVPASSPPTGLFSVTSSEVQHYDPATNTFQNIAGLPVVAGTTVSSPMSGTVGQAGFQYGVYDPYDQTVYAVELYSIVDGYWPPQTHFYYEVFGYNLNTNTWTPVQYIENNYMYGWYMTEDLPDQMFYDPVDHNVYILYSQIDMYGDYAFQLDYVNASTTLSSPLTTYSNTNLANAGAWPIEPTGVGASGYYNPNAAHGDGRWFITRYDPFSVVNMDQTTGNLYYTAASWLNGSYYADDYAYNLEEDNIQTGQPQILPASIPGQIFGRGAAYDPQNGLIYFGGWTNNQTPPFTTNDTLYSYNPVTNQTQTIGPMPNYNSALPDPYVNYVNGHILVDNGGYFEYHPDTNTYTPAPFVNAVYDSQLNELVAPGGNFYDSNLNWVSSASGGGGELSYGLASGGPNTSINYFPYWAFQSMPSYVPTSLFSNQSVSSGGGFWTQSGDAPNGTAFFESTFNLPSTQQVTLQIPTADDYEVVYVDGKPVLQSGDSRVPNAPGATTGNTATITLPTGLHQVVIQGVNTNGFNSKVPNPAAVSLQILDGSNQVLVANNASSWKTTGYVSQLPAGWFSGSIGTFNWTEYVMQEDPSQPIYQQQNFSVTSTPQNVTATSAPVSVTWYQYEIGLSADPTILPVTHPTFLSAVSTTGGPAGDVIEIYDQTTGKVVGDSAPGASTYGANWTENAPATDTFISYFKNPSTGSQDQTSNTVDVEWQQIKLTLSDAEIYHTPAWLQHLQDYNQSMQQNHPDLVRPLSYFWAGEELKFKVKPSVSTISSANVMMPGLEISSYAPGDAPINFSAPFSIPLTYDPSTGYLEGNTDPVWGRWMQYLDDGSYTVTFWVRSQDNQVASMQAQFTIDAPWVSAGLRSYYNDGQIY